MQHAKPPLPSLFFRTLLQRDEKLRQGQSPAVRGELQSVIHIPERKPRYVIDLFTSVKVFAPTNFLSSPPATQAFGGTDYSFLSTTTSTPDSVHSAKKDLPQQQGALPPQQSTPTTSIKKKRSVVNLFSYNNISELLTNQQQSSPSNSSQQPSMQAQPPASQVQQSICDTNTVSSKRYSAFNNISFDTNLDFLSFVSLYRSFR